MTPAENNTKVTLVKSANINFEKLRLGLSLTSTKLNDDN
jgi:hypothetical protein